MDQSILDLGISRYERMTGLDEMERDEEGFIILKPSAERVDKKMHTLTTDITNLEAKLKKFKEEKAQTEKYKKSDDYKESVKRLSKKKQKKQKTALLEMVFNNADAPEEEEEMNPEEGGSYVDKKPRQTKKKADTTLDTTYGKRFSPVVAMLHDTIVEFDNIAAEIEGELKDARNSSKSMYRSSQIGNLISAKNSKLSAVKELASVAKTVSDLEYKKEKDRQSSEGSDTSKAISNLGAKYLRGAFDLFDDDDSDKKKKSKTKSSGKKPKTSKAYENDDDDEDEDDETGSLKKQQREDDERALAAEFAKSLMKKKSDIKFTPAERYINIEGKYSFVVACDPLDPENTWKFVAVDPKSGKELKDFKDKYKDLYPKRKNCRMRFDMQKLRVTELNSSRVYKLVLKD